MYNPGVQSIGGQLIAQSMSNLGQGVGDAIRQYKQNKIMAAQAVGKFEGALRANPEIIDMLSDRVDEEGQSPGGRTINPAIIKAFSKLQSDGALGVRDAALLAQFADTYSQEKNTQAQQAARAQQAAANFLRAQQSAPTVMPLDQVKQQFPHDQYDANLVPVPGQPGNVQVKGVSPRAPQTERFQPVDMGDKVGVFNDKSGEVVRTVPKNPATPSGYKATPEGMAPIPGGPADAERKAKEEAERQRTLGESTRLDVMLNAINEVLPKVSSTTAGVGAMLSSLPGTPAYDMAAKLDTLKANIGFKQLADMRAASPTGGALGQVAVKELDYLQAALGNLDKWQSPAQLKETLGKIQTHLQRWQKAVKGENPDGEATPDAKPAASESLQIKSVRRVN